MISIIIPCYNAVQTIDRAVQSCLKQAHVREIILVDDGSTDGTLKMLRQYERQYDAVRVYQMPQNGGASMARNWGVLHSRAPYLAFLDADDEYLNDAFVFSVQALASLPHLAAIKLPCQFVDWPADVVEHPTYQDTCAVLVNTFAGNLLIRREVFMALGMFADVADFRAQGGEDGAFMLSLVSHFTVGQVLHETPVVSIYYHEGSHGYRYFKIQQGDSSGVPDTTEFDTVKVSYEVIEQNRLSLLSLLTQLDPQHPKGFQPLWRNDVESAK